MTFLNNLLNDFEADLANELGEEVMEMTTALERAEAEIAATVRTASVRRIGECHYEAATLNHGSLTDIAIAGTPDGYFL